MAEKKSGIDQALIRDLANILNETDLTEIEVEQDDLRIRVSRNGTIAFPLPPSHSMCTPIQGPAPVPIPYQSIHQLHILLRLLLLLLRLLLRATCPRP